jgi:hypothetical protein
MRGTEVGLLAFVACAPGNIEVPGGDPSAPPSIATSEPQSTPPTALTGARLFDASRVLVLPDGAGVEFMASDGTIVGTLSWESLVGPCDGCTGEGASADGDGLLVSWQVRGADAGVGRIDSTGALEFAIGGLEFPHDAVRDPSDDSIIVPEAFADRISWFAGDGSSDEPVRVLDDQDPGWDQPLPSGIDRILGEDGSVYLVANNRGGFPEGGIITMWDITRPDAPEELWRFPSTGALDTPHGAVIRAYKGRFWLLWAHSYGAPAAGGGSVGIAVSTDLRTLPAYVADLTMPDPVGPLDFVRGVELTSDGELWITDSGAERLPAANGRVIEAAMPDLSPTGATGAVSTDQVFVELPEAHVVASGLPNPFEGWLWTPTIAF